MAKNKRYGGKDYVPVSIRFAREEKNHLLEQAGSQSLSSFIRKKALEGMEEKPRRKQRKKRRKPTKSDKQMARLLGVFMNSRIAGNINQMARQAHSGSLIRHILALHGNRKNKSQTLKPFLKTVPKHGNHWIMWLAGL